MNKQIRYVIPPDPLKFGTLVVVTIGSGILMFAGVEFDYPIVDPWCLFIVGIGCLIATSRYYVIDANCITEKLLFISVHRVYWEFVKQILLFDKSNDDKRTKEEAVFILTRHGCDIFNSATDSISTYLSQYGNLVTKIAVPSKKKQKYKEWFERAYGSVLEFE